MATVFENRLSEYHRFLNYCRPGSLPALQTAASPVMYDHTAEFQYSARYREYDNFSPHSIGSSAGSSSSGGYPSLSPRAVDTPSPPTPASATKLYNLLKNPGTSTYNVEETWGGTEEQPLDLKRKWEDPESPVDLSTHKRPRLNASYSPAQLEERYVQSARDYDCAPSGGDCHDYNCSCSGSGICCPEMQGYCPVGYKRVYEAQSAPRRPQHHSRPTPRTTPQPTEQFHYHQRHYSAANTCPSPTAPARALTDSQGPSLLQSILEAGASGTTMPSEYFVANDLDQSGSTIVCLAKKNLLPVTARVSDWLVKIIDFALSMPEFNCLTENDKTELIYNSWTRLLLICMAETSFEFVVTPVMDSSKGAGCETLPPPSDDTPTMRKVERIQQFIKKCQSLKVDADEFKIMKKIVLFSTDSSDLDMAPEIEDIAARARQALHVHTKQSLLAEKMRYSHLLMSLPLLYGVHSKVMEQLFCSNISQNANIASLLDEMLKRQ